MAQGEMSSSTHGMFNMRTGSCSICSSLSPAWLLMSSVDGTSKPGIMPAMASVGIAEASEEYTLCTADGSAEVSASPASEVRLPATEVALEMMSRRSGMMAGTVAVAGGAPAASSRAQAKASSLSELKDMAKGLKQGSKREEQGVLGLQAARGI